MTLEEALETSKGRRRLTIPPVANRRPHAAMHSRPSGFWPRPTNIFASATICTPTGADPPLLRRRPRVCRQTDGVRTGIAVPRLAVGCMEPFLPSNTHSGAFELARNLLLAGVGQPEDWERSKGDPVAFMLQTVEHTPPTSIARRSMPVAHTDILFGTSPYISNWQEKQYERSGPGVLAVEATHISIVYLRPTLETAREGASPAAGNLLLDAARRRGVLDPLLRRVRLRDVLRVGAWNRMQRQGER